MWLQSDPAQGCHASLPIPAPLDPAPGQQKGERLAHRAARPHRQQAAPEAKHKAGAQDEHHTRQEQRHHGGVHACVVWW